MLWHWTLAYLLGISNQYLTHGRKPVSALDEVNASTTTTLKTMTIDYDDVTYYLLFMKKGRIIGEKPGKIQQKSKRIQGFSN